VVITDESIGVSRLLVAHARAPPPKSLHLWYKVNDSHNYESLKNISRLRCDLKSIYIDGTFFRWFQALGPEKDKEQSPNLEDQSHCPEHLQTIIMAFKINSFILD